MKTSDAILALRALAHDARLALYRHLVQAGPNGLRVGSLRALGGHAGATLSNHLNVLRRARLVHDRRQGRHIVCRADYARMNALLAYLTENCCAGTPCDSDVAHPSPIVRPTRSRRR